jgi:hypothetical protein
MGRSTVKICRIPVGSDEKTTLTTECLNEHQLVQAAGGAQPGWSTWYVHAVSSGHCTRKTGCTAFSAH